MIGIVDVGGGNRDIYGAGILDYCIDHHIDVPYFIGVSAGSANGVSYIAKQRKRNYKFYTEYSQRKQYMSVSNFFKKGSLLDLDYIYSTLSNTNGEYPVDYDAFFKSKKELVVVTTNAHTSEPTYFNKKDIKIDNLDIIKASCCVPVVCKAYEIQGVQYYDGGLSDPIPYKKAFEDGCSKVIVILTKPKDFYKSSKSDRKYAKLLKKKYPETSKKLEIRSNIYNESLNELIDLENQGKALILAPINNEDMETFEKDKNKLDELYNLGYSDGSKIKEFLERN